MSARDHARGLVADAGGAELLERLDHLDERAFAAPPPSTPPLVPPRRGDRRDADVVIGGGGLWSLLAPLLAARGLSVIVCDRARVGAGHREWNAGARELEALGALGLFTPAELDALVVARYASGTVRWHRGRTHRVRGVLDAALDAGGLLARARSLSLERGVTLLDGVEVEGVVEGSGGVRVALRDRASGRWSAVTASRFVDARGAASPFGRADLACPTVGGVIRGLVEERDDPGAIDPGVGEILATIDDVDTRQHLWEAFPGRRGETTVYLFRYALAAAMRPGDLVELYARFFADLRRYKRGEARLVRPTFGVIPGWSRLVPAAAAPGPRITLVGDAAARHSPLTFCGFGASVRSFGAVAAALAGDATTVPLDDAPLHAGTGALARMLATPSRDPARAGDLNDLLEAAFVTLDEMGEAAFADLLNDRMSARAFAAFLGRTSARRPRVYRDVLATLGAGGTLRWAASLAREVARA